MLGNDSPYKRCQGGADYDAFCRIVHASQQLLVGSFCGHKAVLRGGIGYGDLAVNDYNNLLGSAAEYSTIKGLALDWTLTTYEGASEKGMQASTDPHALRIIENTKAFETWARTNNR